MPIITTKVSIITDLVRYRKNGIIIPRTVKAIRKEDQVFDPPSREAQRMGKRNEKNNCQAMDLGNMQIRLGEVLSQGVSCKVMADGVVRMKVLLVPGAWDGRLIIGRKIMSLNWKDIGLI